MIEKLSFLDSTINCVDYEGYIHNVAEGGIINKINELVDAVNELQNRIDPPSVYQVMKDKDAIIGKHIGEKQRLQDELDRTRKALDVAVDALGYYASENSWDETNRWMFVENGFEFARDVLVKIDKALEQKD